jgi:exodeoxyribonuclease V beta subunit
LHGIFENLDFRANSEKIKDIVENKLGGFKEFSKDDPKGESRKFWVENKIDLILKKPLKDAGKLCEIDTDKKAAELGYLMNCEKVDLQKIKKIMGEKIPDVFEKKMFDSYIKGFIDLIFKNKDEKYYILDWKSNNCNGDFSEKRINEEMVNHGYHLQYYIYAVALKRWLEKTQEFLDFKKHFGGVFYIFIRGVNNENDDGIFYADGKNLVCDIEKLDAVLMEKE